MKEISPLVSHQLKLITCGFSTQNWKERVNIFHKAVIKMQHVG
jgi:hypothetical protein